MRTQKSGEWSCFDVRVRLEKLGTKLGTSSPLVKRAIRWALMSWEGLCLRGALVVVGNDDN